MVAPSAAVTSIVIVLAPTARSTVPSASTVPSSLIMTVELGLVASAVTVVDVTPLSTLAV